MPSVVEVDSSNLYVSPSLEQQQEPPVVRSPFSSLGPRVGLGFILLFDHFGTSYPHGCVIQTAAAAASLPRPC